MSKQPNDNIQKIVIQTWVGKKQLADYTNKLQKLISVCIQSGN